jgi:hypothetical protein
VVAGVAAVRKLSEKRRALRVQQLERRLDRLRREIDDAEEELQVLRYIAAAPEPKPGFYPRSVLGEMLARVYDRAYEIEWIESLKPRR